MIRNGYATASSSTISALQGVVYSSGASLTLSGGTSGGATNNGTATIVGGSLNIARPGGGTLNLGGTYVTGGAGVTSIGAGGTIASAGTVGAGALTIGPGSPTFQGSIQIIAGTLFFTNGATSSNPTLPFVASQLIIGGNPLSSGGVIHTQNTGDTNTATIPVTLASSGQLAGLSISGTGPTLTLDTGTATTLRNTLRLSAGNLVFAKALSIPNALIGQTGSVRITNSSDKTLALTMSDGAIQVLLSGATFQHSGIRSLEFT